MTTNPRRAVRRSRLQRWPHCCSPAARRATSASPGSARWRRAGRATASPPPIRRCRMRAAGRCSGSRSGRCATAPRRRAAKRSARPVATRDSTPSPGWRGCSELTRVKAKRGRAEGPYRRPPEWRRSFRNRCRAPMPRRLPPRRPRNRQPPPFRPNPAHRRPNRLRRRTVRKRTDLRTGEVVARIWIAPFVDADGIYREASYIRVVLEPAGWRLP